MGGLEGVRHWHAEANSKGHSSPPEVRGQARVGLVPTTAGHLSATEYPGTQARIHRSEPYASNPESESGHPAHRADLSR